jgi:c-di-GMP-binding flagellar brake protein YcgR
MAAASLDVLLARDISVGGVGVSVSHGFEGSDLNATLELIIKLPDRKAFMVKGIVRYTNAKLCLFGIEFLQLPERAKADLTEYVRQMVALGRSRPS